MRNNNTLKKNIVKLLYQLINNLLYFDDTLIREIFIYISLRR